MRVWLQSGWGGGGGQDGEEEIGLLSGWEVIYGGEGVWWGYNQMQD